MAEIQENDSKKNEKNKRGKMVVRMDSTLMVDMNMLLIILFILCTSLSKLQAMEINMPNNDKNIIEEQQIKAKTSQAITLLLGDSNKLCYYSGESNYKDYISLKGTSYQVDGLGATPLQCSRIAVNEVDKLKQQKLELRVPGDDFRKQLSEIKSGKDTPIVITKAANATSYKNLINVPDEMQTYNIGKHVITDTADVDQFLTKNYESRGKLSQDIVE